MKSTTRQPIDPLRRFAIELGGAAGLSIPRSTTLAGFCLWFELAGWPDHGLARLPFWLEKLESGESDPKAIATINRPESAASAVLDARGLLAPLALDQAAGLAAEKAREAGIGLIRLRQLDGSIGSASAIVASLASGPFGSLFLDQAGSLAIAVPSIGGPPMVFDSSLAAKPLESGLVSSLSSLPSILLGEGDSLILAARDSLLFPVDSIRDRLESASEAPGLLWPDSFEARRRQIFETGLPVSKPTRDRLKVVADRLGVVVPWSKKA